MNMLYRREERSLLKSDTDIHLVPLGFKRLTSIAFLKTHLMALAESLSKPRDILWTKHIKLKARGEIWKRGSLGNKMELGTLL